MYTIIISSPWQPQVLRHRITTPLPPPTPHFFFLNYENIVLYPPSFIFSLVIHSPLPYHLSASNSWGKEGMAIFAVPKYMSWWQPYKVPTPLSPDRILVCIKYYFNNFNPTVLELDLYRTVKLFAILMGIWIHINTSTDSITDLSKA